MIAHYYCMACGLLLPHTARSPNSTTRLQCPHCHCEMELPSLPSPGHPLLSPSTPGGGSNSSVYSYVEGFSELDGGVKDMRRLRLSSVGASTDTPVYFEQPHSGVVKREEEREQLEQSGDEFDDGGEDSQNNSRNNSRRTKSKKKRDPLAPKRAANAYMLFCKEQRPLLKIREPDLHFSVIGQRLGDMWRTLPSEEKRPYEDAAADDRDRYKNAMHQYTTSGIRSSIGERQQSGGDDGPYSHQSSPMMMSMTGNGHSHMPAYSFHRPSDPLPFSTMPAPNTSASASTPTSPYTYTPSTPSRYQPYPVHSSPSNAFHTYPGLSSAFSSGPSYSSVKRTRSHSRQQLDYGAPLDRSMMSEQEYFTALYYYTVQQQKIINEEIRRYGRQRTQFAQLPPELQRQMMVQMGGLRGGDMQPDMQPDMQAMMPLPPPSYERGDSTGSATGGGGMPASSLPSLLPPFLPDYLDSSMEESISYASEDPQQPPSQPWDFSDHMH